MIPKGSVVINSACNTRIHIYKNVCSFFIAAATTANDTSRLDRVEIKTCETERVSSGNGLRPVQGTTLSFPFSQIAVFHVNVRSHKILLFQV